MIAIDMNVLVRLLIADDAAQARRARRLVEKSEVLVSSTVLLESEWVLRSAYGIEPGAISAAFRGFLGLPNVASDVPAALAEALDRYDAGYDFADALHLASAHKASSFYTFDKRLVRRAKGGKPQVEMVPD